MEDLIQRQFENVRRIRSASLESVSRHRLLAADDESFACSCGYGLGDVTGDLEGRYRSHLAEAGA